MRVIAGTARSLQLKTIDGDGTRPTTDRIKETLFNVLQFQIEGTDFLDLFAGSGAIGIEALSRGARSCTFVDANPKAAACIMDNVKHCRFEEASEVIRSDFTAAITRLSAAGRYYRLVFIDPPYNMGMERRAMQLLKTAGITDEKTCFVIEADIRDDLTDEIEAMGYSLVKEKLYKTNKHVFFRMNGEKG